MGEMYEVLEWIVNEQPKVSLDVKALKLRFWHVDPLLLVYAESNVYATLTTCTGGKASNTGHKAEWREAIRLLLSKFILRCPTKLQEHFQLNAVRFNNELELDFWTKGVAAIAVNLIWQEIAKAMDLQSLRANPRTRRTRARMVGNRTEN